MIDRNDITYPSTYAKIHASCVFPYVDHIVWDFGVVNVGDSSRSGEKLTSG